ncbi:HlyD family type I secretion periplasmic adaptor subunit [Sphingobium sp. AN558]|uniref:HlyD family type I secretion periplasmic adaptor subunit n=1 Tax=Sphingobium sp. AN558 TaxID=3133442 RepID=UPI0030C323A9
MQSDPGSESMAYDPDIAIARKSRHALWAVLALIMVLVIGGALIPIGAAVIASGRIGIEGRVKRISHQYGGTVATIAVTDGSSVSQGQALIRLDDSVSSVDATLSSSSADELRAKLARLDAERLSLPAIRFPDDLLRRRDASARRAMADEARLFAVRNRQMSGEIALLRTRVVQAREEIASYRAQIAALREQGVLIQPELEGLRKLYEKQLVTIGRKSQLERAAVQIQGSIAALSANIAGTEAKVAEAETEILQTAQRRRAEAGVEHEELKVALNQQDVRRASAGEAQNRMVIRAPVDGVVEKLRVHSPGELVRPGDQLMEIVPRNDILVVEGVVAPSDIDQVRVGQPARIRFSAFNVRTTPEITGKVIFVASNETTSEDNQRSFYTVRLAIDRRAVADAGLALRPGMPAEIFISTGSRSMLSYVTKPLVDQMALAFRDN